MKKYVKPSINVIELQLKENIAAVPTTVYKGNSRTQAVNSQKAVQLALSSEGSGIQNGDYTVS